MMWASLINMTYMNNVDFLRCLLNGDNGTYLRRMNR